MKVEVTVTEQVGAKPPHLKSLSLTTADGESAQIRNQPEVATPGPVLWKGYALFTDQALKSMKCSKENYFKRCETYEHQGDVKIFCRDMHARYEEMKSS